MGGKLNKVGEILEMGRILKVRGALYFEVMKDGKKKTFQQESVKYKEYIEDN